MLRIWVQLWPFLMSVLLFTSVIIFILEITTPKALSTSSTQPTASSDLNFGVIVDAGSSGSRLFLYCWPPHSGDPHDLIAIKPVTDSENKPIVKKISPGLSSLADPQNATEYMKPLLDLAADNIPQNKHNSTPVFIMATAGMRLLPQSSQDQILDNLRKELPKLYKFQILANHIEVISGKWEGIYSWVAVNYILGRFDHKDIREGESRKPTVGMIDMGGASVQIAFEISGPLPSSQNLLTESVNLGCKEHDAEHQYRIYVSTFLGYGANEATSRYEKLLYQNLTQGKSVRDPCLPVNLVKTVSLEEKTFTRKGVGDFDKCLNSVKPLIDRTKPCPDTPCSINGVHQPPVDVNKMEFFGFSEYWYTMQDVLAIGGRYDFKMFEKSAQDFCKSRWSEIQERRRNNVYPRADMDRIRTQCFKSAWIATVLHEGFGFSKSKNNFRSAMNINEQEVQWALGAILFKMRHFPLRMIQRQELLKQQEKYSKTTYLPSGGFAQFLILICISFMAFVVIRYILIVRNRKYMPKLPRNRSMTGYMMVDTDENNVGLRIEPSDYVY